MADPSETPLVIPATPTVEENLDAIRAAAEAPVSVVLQGQPEVQPVFPITIGHDVLPGVDTATADTRNPGEWVGLDEQAIGTYRYVQIAAYKSRRLLIDGVNYEHTDTDVNGVWLYCAM